MSDFTDFINSPEGMGLLSAAFGGLAGARRGAPINSIGNAGMAGLLGYNNAINSQATRDMRDAQVQGMKAQRAAQQRQMDAVAAMPQEVQSAVAAGVPYQEIWKRQNPENKYQTVGNTLVEVGANGVKPAYTAQAPEGATPWYVKRNADGSTSIDPAFADFEKAKAAFGRPPAQPMAPVAYVDEKGNTVWGTIAEAKGKPAANFSPSVQGAVTAAKKDAETAATTAGEAKKAVKKSEQLISVAEQAKEILNSNVTQSIAGAGVDVASRLIGVSPESSRNAAKLETIAGWMVSNVPRMEGPQSNIDLKNYQTMAGSIGDRTIPVKERQAALAEVIKLQNQYKELNQDLVHTPGAPVSGVRKYNPATGRIE